MLFCIKKCKLFSVLADIFLRMFAKCKDKSCTANFYTFAKKQPREDKPLKLKVIILDLIVS